jgi:SSS family solute:Na+ symporter
MAQNFYIAIFAWTICFVVTILVSLMTAPKPEPALRDLVYGLTDFTHVDAPWHQRPVTLAAIVGVLVIALNVIFW